MLITKCPERLRMRAFVSLEGFCICTRTMSVSVPSLHRESTDSLIRGQMCKVFEEVVQHIGSIVPICYKMC